MTIILPLFSGRLATSMAATTLAPVEIPTSKPSSFASRIAQRYAYARVTDELRRKGYQLTTEERGRDGSVRVVATRWA